MDCILKFIELDITSNFTFLAGGSHPEEYADRAASFGMDSFAISDVNSVAGIVRAHRQCVRIALNKQSIKTALRAVFYFVSYGMRFICSNNMLVVQSMPLYAISGL